MATRGLRHGKRTKGFTMVIAPRPELNLLAGWRYLFSKSYRQEMKEEWQAEPAWVVAIQLAAGTCSVLFPLIIVGLLAFVAVTRHL